MLVAHIWLVAISRLECKSPIQSECKKLYLPSLDLVQRESWCCFITKSPIIESVDSIVGMARICHIRNTLQIPKYLKIGNFMKFLSVKIRISSKLCI